MVTFKSIALGIEPTWELEDWFHWPPNIFALVSLVLQRTGAYKVCLKEKPHWEDSNWKFRVARDADIWINQVGNGIYHRKLNFNPVAFDILKEHYQTLLDDWNSISANTMDLNQLRSFGEGPHIRVQNKNRARKFAITLCTILAISDSSGSGLGLTGSGILDDDNTVLYRAFANMLLVTTGTVSTIDKFHGAVFPKTRTPRSGIVLRSMSHNLTFHQTEVEVMWRTFPWFDEHKQFMNVMVVPYPFKSDKSDFVAVRPNTHINRYFKGNIKTKIDENILESIVIEVFARHNESCTIDLLVFPEMSLTQEQYNYLLNCFSEKFDLEKTKYFNKKTTIELPKNLPIIVSGVLDSNEEGNSNEMSPLNNEARIAVFFDGKWYDISQRKHHRWQLDRGQITQYDLESYLSADKKWVELCTIMQRRLTVLAPNGWLTLTALICEDLARQEPVSEVIRGIGPTLLTALLSDGPQINARWSARYANVLADDPGTSVLSITSKGMAARSRKKDGSRTPDESPLTIGLWRDMIDGWNDLDLERDSDAIIFTISSNYEKEYTLDGRGDGGVSSVFRMDSMKPTQIKFKDRESTLLLERATDTQPSPYDINSEDVQTNKIKNDYFDKKISKETLRQNTDFGNWYDIRSLSAVNFVIDSLLDLCLTSNREKIHSCTNLILDLFKKEYSKNKSIFERLTQNIIMSWETPSKVGTSTETEKLNELLENEAVVTAIRAVISEFVEKLNTDIVTSRYLILIKICSKESFAIENDIPTPRTVRLIFLNSMQSKIAAIREMGINLNKTNFNDLFEQVSKQLFNSINMSRQNDNSHNDQR